MTETTGRRPAILVVEDEWILAELIAETLKDEGYAVVGPVGRVSEALQLMETTKIDAAVLDVCLGPERSFPIAEKLLAANVPFIFMTGYGIADLPASYRGVLTLPKPIWPEKIVQILRVILKATI